LKYYPVYLHLKGRSVLLVGAGKVAEQKLRQLLDSGARIHVVSPMAEPGIRRLAQDDKIKWSKRLYKTSDTRGVCLVIAATDDPRLQKKIAHDARRRSIWVNVVDVPGLCDFIAPAIVSHGDMQIAISTGGAAPALAKHLRKNLEQLMTLGYDDFVKTAKKLRPAILKLPKEKRLAVWRKLIYGR
jgi:precorrin-2 dehydrogenase/sirohydrochlorin ferrochelatase